GERAKHALARRDAHARERMLARVERAVAPRLDARVPSALYVAAARVAAARVRLGRAEARGVVEALGRVRGQARRRRRAGDNRVALAARVLDLHEAAARGVVEFAAKESRCDAVAQRCNSETEDARHDQELRI